jgi:predicted Ser/Thr protein kinase
MAKQQTSFQEIFDLDADRKRKEASRQKVISFREYLELLRGDPQIAQNSPARLREMVLKHGIEEIPEAERWLGISKRYSLFSENLYGVEKPISDFIGDHDQAGPGGLSGPSGLFHQGMPQT